MTLQVAVAVFAAALGIGLLARRSPGVADHDSKFSPGATAELDRHFANDGPERLLPPLGLEALRRKAVHSRRAATRLRRLLRAELRRAADMREQFGNDSAMLHELERTVAAAEAELALVERTRGSLPFWS